MKRLSVETIYCHKIDAPLVFKVYQNVGNVQSEENQYLDLIKDILINGEKKNGRNGTVYSIFGPQHIFNISDQFPLLTTKRMNFDAIVKELLFFLRGDTNTKILEDQSVSIWKKNTSRKFLDSRGLNYDEGDMGPMYGWNWRYFGLEYKGCDYCYKNDTSDNKTHDQLWCLLNGLVNDPNSRRHLLTTYDPTKVKDSVLAPCHGLIVQFSVNNNGKLSCKMYQRSVDTMLGYPFNIASYAFLTYILCHVTGYKPGYLILTLGDTHIYEEHIDSARKQINRMPLLFPKLEITKHIDPNADIDDRIKFIEELRPNDISLLDYNCHPAICMNMVP